MFLIISFLFWKLTKSEKKKSLMNKQTKSSNIFFSIQNTESRVSLFVCYFLLFCFFVLLVFVLCHWAAILWNRMIHWYAVFYRVTLFNNFTEDAPCLLSTLSILLSSVLSWRVCDCLKIVSIYSDLVDAAGVVCHHLGLLGTDFHAVGRGGFVEKLN